MSAGLNQLATIIKRLEAATSRLEDLAVTGAAGQPSSSTSTGAVAAPAPPAAAAAPAAPAPPAAATVAPSVSAEVPRSVEAYDEAIDDKLKAWLALTRSFASQSVIEQVGHIEQMFADQRTLLFIASACKKPSDAEFGELLRPLQADIEGVSKAKETYRKDRDWASHLTFVAEGAPVAGWVTITPKPAPHIKEMADAAQFWGNRVLKEFKEKDPKHGEFVRGYLQIFEALRKYVMEYHTTGLAWNARSGVSVKDYQPASSGPSSAGGPPPPPPPPGPPPPPPPPPPAAAPAPAAGGGGSIGAVFADLNKGEAITSGLRKVDKSQMTHKNPELRAQPGVAPKPASAVGKRPALPRKPESLQAKKPSKFVLEGSKWAVEYQEGETLTIEETDRNQTVNLFACKNSTVVIKGKVNAITLVNCKKTAVLVDSVISSISVTASDNFTVQVTGTAPTLQIDTTNSGQIYLSKECAEVVEITTAKCSAINISLPVPGEEDGVFEEKAVPEMFRSSVQGGKLVTTIVEHSG